MSIQGVLSPRLEPVITLTLRNDEGKALSTDVVMDTGFNDFLTVNPEIISNLGLEAVGTLLVELSDGTVRALNYYPVRVDWLGEEQFIMAQDGIGTSLAGMMLLLDCEMTIQVHHEGAVAIARLVETA
jgi:clan AA aspartic protease